MIPVIRWSWHLRRWSTLWWSLGVAAFIALTLTFYPIVHHQSAQLNQSLGQLSGSVKSFVTDTPDFFSPVGYLSSQILYLLLPILLAILLIGLGSSLLAREEQDGSLELLLARPISRRRLLAGKAVAGLLISLTVTVVSLVTTLVLCKLVQLPLPLPAIVAAIAECYLLALVFGALAFALTCFGGPIRGVAIGLSTGLLLLSYLLSSLEASVSWLRWPARLLPYHYYRPASVLGGHTPWAVGGSFLLVIAVLAVLGVWGFRRRDIG